MSIESFKSKFKEFARQNRFKVECTKFSAPELILNVTMPARLLLTDTFKPKDNITMKVPYMKADGDVTITFLSDIKYTCRKDLISWHNEIVNEQGSFSYLNEYAADIKIMQLDRKENIIWTSTLIKGYPIDISSINLDASANNALSTFSATFAGSFVKEN